MLDTLPTDIQFGDVLWGEVSGEGGDKPRPWVVVMVSDDGKAFLCHPCTTQEPKPTYVGRVEVRIKGKQSWVNTSKLVTMELRHFISLADTLSQEAMDRVIEVGNKARAPISLLENRSVRAGSLLEPIHSLLEWEDVLKYPPAEQKRYLENQLKVFTLQELCKHWNVHHRTIQARIIEPSAKRNASKAQKPAAPVDEAQDEAASMSVAVLAGILELAECEEVRVLVDGRYHVLKSATVIRPLSGVDTREKLVLTAEVDHE